MKYYILPKKIDATVEADTKEDAMLSFAESMDGDMNTYFEAFTEDEYLLKLKTERDEAEKNNIIDFMCGVLEQNFHISEDYSGTLAILAYEHYVDEGGTQYDAVQYIYDKTEKEIIDAVKEIENGKNFRGDIELHVTNDTIEIREYIEEDWKSYVRKTIPCQGFSETNIYDICNDNAWCYQD